MAEKNNPMIEEKSWDEFLNTGLLWFINRTLHLFGWAIAVDYKNGEVVKAFPARVKFRGFDYETEGKNFIKLNEYMVNKSSEILDETIKSVFNV